MMILSAVVNRNTGVDGGRLLSLPLLSLDICNALPS